MTEQKKGWLKCDWLPMRVFGHLEKNKTNRFEVSLVKQKFLEADDRGNVPEDKFWFQIKTQYLVRDGNASDNGDWRYGKGGVVGLNLGALEPLAEFVAAGIVERDKAYSGHYAQEQSEPEPPKPKSMGKKPGFLK